MLDYRMCMSVQQHSIYILITLYTYLLHINWASSLTAACSYGEGGEGTGSTKSWQWELPTGYCITNI